MQRFIFGPGGEGGRGNAFDYNDELILSLYSR